MNNVLPQMVAAGAALLGVVLTLIVTDIRERNKERANDRRLELTRAFDRAKWLDSERREAYSSLIVIVRSVQDILMGAAPRDGSAWIEERLADSYQKARRLALDAETVFASIRIVGSDPIQETAELLVKSLDNSYHKLDIALDSTFRGGQIFTSEERGELPDVPVDLTFQLYANVEETLKEFVKLARREFIPREPTRP